MIAGFLPSTVPWEPTTFIFMGYNPYLGGVKLSFLMVLGSKRYVLFEVWYAAYVAARAGFGSLLLQLPEVAGPCAERCSMLRPVCNLLAKRLYL